MSSAPPTCFFEAEPGAALSRRAAAEGIGTLFLAFTASAAGLSAARLFPAYPAAVTFFVACSVGGVLVAFIIAFGKLSGGHYNPLITGLQMLAGERSPRCAAVYIALQLLGGLAGGTLAAAIWRTAPSLAGGLGSAGVASEFVASMGLMLVVFGSARSVRPETGPFAVGAWLVGAIIATPTGSYANPAVTLGAVVTAGPLALGGGSALLYIGAQLAGALVALGIVSVLLPSKGGSA